MSLIVESVTAQSYITPNDETFYYPVVNVIDSDDQPKSTRIRKAEISIDGTGPGNRNYFQTKDECIKAIQQQFHQYIGKPLEIFEEHSEGEKFVFSKIYYLKNRVQLHRIEKINSNDERLYLSRNGWQPIPTSPDAGIAYVTLSNSSKIVFSTNINSLNLAGAIYKIPIYFFSKYEKNALLSIQELLKNPEKYFTEIYLPNEAIDTLKYVHEGKQPAYHKYSCCPKLNSDYEDFEIPFEIREKGPEAIEKFRDWFNTVKHLLEKPDVFVARLQARWGIITNPKAINKSNSGSTKVENFTIKELEKLIDGLIKEAGHFYKMSAKNTTILSKFGKYTYLANKSDSIKNNDTGYTDEEVKTLLKQYDREFKKPAKKYLIEYYRLKLNQEIKMQGYFLENLGFKPCAFCHDYNYLPKAANEINSLESKE